MRFILASRSSRRCCGLESALGAGLRHPPWRLSFRAGSCVRGESVLVNCVYVRIETVCCLVLLLAALLACLCVGGEVS